MRQFGFTIGSEMHTTPVLVATVLILATLKGKTRPSSYRTARATSLPVQNCITPLLPKSKTQRYAGFRSGPLSLHLHPDHMDPSNLDNRPH